MLAACIHCNRKTNNGIFNNHKTNRGLVNLLIIENVLPLQAFTFFPLYLQTLLKIGNFIFFDPVSEGFLISVVSVSRRQKDLRSTMQKLTIKSRVLYIADRIHHLRTKYKSACRDFDCYLKFLFEVFFVHIDSVYDALLTACPFLVIRKHSFVIIEKEFLRITLAT